MCPLLAVRWIAFEMPLLGGENILLFQVNGYTHINLKKKVLFNLKHMKMSLEVVSGGGVFKHTRQIQTSSLL